MTEHTLAVKSLNQYRRRDIFSYVGLRYYLDNQSARENHWIDQISVALTIDSPYQAYLKLSHYKEHTNGVYTHRDIFLPAPNEVLSETALITELSKYKIFEPKPYVYSYRFSSESEITGVFEPYFNGYKQRHESILEACMSANDSFVLYTDIKRFYPSIKSSDAQEVWNRICDKTSIDRRFKQLGNKMLANHLRVCEDTQSANGLLTGPMFSHVIANLLLMDVDIHLHELTNGNYWRYVDDIVFVGSIEDIATWRESLSTIIGVLDLQLHDGEKDFVVSAREWLEGENDLNEGITKNWISLVADTKRFLLANPNSVNELRDAYSSNNIRIPAIDYSNTVTESSYLERFQDWRSKYRWSLRAVTRIDIEHLIASAKKCEAELVSRMDEILLSDQPTTPFQQKRVTPKLRFYGGRLLYLLNDDELMRLSKRLVGYADLHLLCKVMEAVGSKNITEIVQMGVNASHMAAQLLKTDDSAVQIDTFDFGVNGSIVDQSIAVFELNGIEITNVGEISELRQLSRAENLASLMQSQNGFIKEFACLHGLGGSRHQSMLDVSFDRNEDLALDVINQLQVSSSF